MQPGQFHTPCDDGAVRPRELNLATRDFDTTFASERRQSSSAMNDPNAVPSNTGASTPEACGLLRRGLIMLYDLMPAIAIVFLAAVIALPVTGDSVRLGPNPLYTLYIFGAWFLYLGLCWTQSGQTLGMRAWKVEVVDAHGNRPDWRTSAIRFAASLLSALPLGLGFWASLAREDRLCWHDRISHTRLQRREPGEGV